MRLTLLNIFLDNIPIFLEGPLNCMCTHISKNVYVLTRKSTYPIKNHLLRSMWNCLFPDNCSVWDRPLIFHDLLENFKWVLLIRLSYYEFVNYNFNADRSTFPWGLLLVYMSKIISRTIYARNNISKLFLAPWKTCH